MSIDWEKTNKRKVVLYVTCILYYYIVTKLAHGEFQISWLLIYLFVWFNETDSLCILESYLYYI